MKNVIPIALKYAAIWLVLSVVFFFSSEKVAKWIAPGFDNVNIWLSVVAVGLFVILILVTIAFILALKRRRQKSENYKN